MKKVITLLLTLTLLLTAIPTISAQAASLSDTKIELNEGDTFTLQLSDAAEAAINTAFTNDMVIWNTTNKNVATVTSDGVVTAVNPGKAKITARVSKKKYVCKVTVVKNIVNIKPSDAYNFVLMDILSNGFYVIDNYARFGKSSYGGDFDTTLMALDDSMMKLSKYNDSINAFDGEEYDDVKTAWVSVYNEVNSLYKQLKDSPPQIGHLTKWLDFSNLTKYLNGYSDECAYFN